MSKRTACACVEKLEANMRRQARIVQTEREVTQQQRVRPHAIGEHPVVVGFVAISIFLECLEVAHDAYVLYSKRERGYHEQQFTVMLWAISKMGMRSQLQQKGHNLLDTQCSKPTCNRTTPGGRQFRRDIDRLARMSWSRAWCICAKRETERIMLFCDNVC